MRKYAYLARLEELLAALPAQERQEALNYYEEYFDAAGTENEEKTAEELGDPADVARNILEGEGIEAEERTPAAPVQAAEEAPPQPGPAPEPAPAAPAGPEPPKLEDPESYPAKGPGAAGKQPGHRRLWLIFWLLVALALVVQVSVLLVGVIRPGGESASAQVEYAESAPVDYGEAETAARSEAEEEGPVQSAPAGTGMTGSGQVTYTTALQTNGSGTLYVEMNCGNVAFQAGDEARIEVRNVDVSQAVSLTGDRRETTFSCKSSDPATHVTITLPANAYDEISVSTSGSGAIELGDLQAETITAVTADGSIQSGWVRAGTLTLQTDRGNIWLEKLTDGTGYHLENVKLLAPEGYVSFTLPGAVSQWNTKITNGNQYTKTSQASQPVRGIPRNLEVEHGSTLKMEYGAT